MIHGPQCHERAQAQKKTTTTAEMRKVRCPHPFWGLSFFWRFWFWFPGVSNVMFMTRSPRSYDTKDCTRHQLHSLLYMGWRRIYFFDEIYGWYCARLNLSYVLMMVDDLIWFDLRLTWLLHWRTRVQSPLSLTIFHFYLYTFRDISSTFMLKAEGRGMGMHLYMLCTCGRVYYWPRGCLVWKLSYLLFLFCLSA